MKVDKSYAALMVSLLIESTESAYLFRYAKSLATDPHQKQQLQVQEGKAREDIEHWSKRIIEEMTGEKSQDDLEDY